MDVILKRQRWTYTMPNCCKQHLCCSSSVLLFRQQRNLWPLWKMYVFCRCVLSGQSATVCACVHVCVYNGHFTAPPATGQAFVGHASDKASVFGSDDLFVQTEIPQQLLVYSP